MTERTPLTEIGEMRISLSDRSFFFKPSFAAMGRIGTGAEIVAAYARVSGAEYVPVMEALPGLPTGAQVYVSKVISKPVYGRHVLSAAYIIMQSCCEEDISVLIGGWKPGRNGVKYIPGIMPVADVITIARELIEHGLIGRSPLKVPQRSESQARTTSEFSVSQYVIAARTHFKLSREEAEDLSMTEYQMMIKNKYPEPAGLTREQYDTVVAAAKDDRASIAAARKKRQASKKEAIK